MNKKERDTLLLLDLNNELIDNIAEVMSNKTCRAILNSLADHAKTETEISEELGLPISTVHYNIQKLVKSGLVDSKEFHYSSKGREVNHYELSKSYVVISPRPKDKIKGLFKRLLTSIIIGVLTLKPALNLMKQVINRGVVLQAKSMSTQNQGLNLEKETAPLRGGITAAPKLSYHAGEAYLTNNPYVIVGVFLVLALLTYLVLKLIYKGREVR